MPSIEKRWGTAGTITAVLLAGSIIVALFLVSISRRNDELRLEIMSLREEFRELEHSITLSNENTLQELNAVRASYQEQVDQVSTALESSTIALAKDISTVDKRLHKGLSGIDRQIDMLGDAVSGLEISAHGSASPVTEILDAHALSAIAAADPTGAQAIADQPGRVAFDAGLEAYGVGRYREASRLFIEASQFDPEDSRARAYVAAADYSADSTASRGQEAKPILDAYLARSGPDALVLRCLIRIASEASDWKGVSSYFFSLELVSSFSAIDYENAALAATYSGESAEAARYWDAASGLQPTSVELLYKAGSAYRKVGQMDIAIARFEACLALEPDYSKAAVDLADIRAQGAASENDL